MDRHNNDNDAHLISLLREGNEQAFNSLYHRYAAEVNRFTYSKTGSREATEEIVQELFIWLWTHRTSLPRTLSLKSYLLKSARNRILNFFRSDRVRRDYAADFQAYMNAHPDPANAQVEATELQEMLYRGLDQLPDRCRLAFRMSRVDNLPIATIAEKMAISHRTVENYITTALKHLRKQLEKAN